MHNEEKYPITEGWYSVTASLKIGASLSIEDMLSVLRPPLDNAEIAYFRCGKISVKLIARKKVTAQEGVTK